MNTAKKCVIIFGNSKQFFSDVYMDYVAYMKCQRHYMNHKLGLTSPKISHDAGSLKLNRQDPRYSMSDYLNLVPKETRQKSNYQEHVGSIYNRRTFVLKDIHHIINHNNIKAPFIINTYKINITEQCNILHLKFVDIKRNAELLINRNITFITSLI